jgi:hypothetical protein
MRTTLKKASTNVLTAYITDVNPSIKSGKVHLKLFLKKGNEEVISELEYSNDIIEYVFDMSKKLPRNISDFDYKIVVFDDRNIDETRKLKLFGNAPYYLSGVIKKIRHDFDIVSRKYNGSYGYFFKKLPGEEKCPECWDKDLGGSNNSNCPICGGTGKMRSFTNPVKVSCGPIKWQQETYSIDNPGKVLANPSVSISAIADIVLTTDDIIYYERTGEFYRVVNRTVSEIQTFPVLQTLVANLLPSGVSEAEICDKKLRGLKK